MKKTTKLVGEDIKTSGQRHIVETVFHEIYGIKVQQVVCCPDCMSDFMVRPRGYELSDDESMATSIVKSKMVSLRARVAPVNGEFKFRQFFIYYISCPFCRKMMLTRIMPGHSYNKLQDKKAFDVMEVFEKGMFVLPPWKMLEALKHEQETFKILERKTTGMKVNLDGIDCRIEYFHG